MWLLVLQESCLLDDGNDNITADNDDNGDNDTDDNYDDDNDNDDVDDNDNYKGPWRLGRCRWSFDTRGGGWGRSLFDKFLSFLLISFDKWASSLRWRQRPVPPSVPDLSASLYNYHKICCQSINTTHENVRRIRSSLQKIMLT